MSCKALCDLLLPAPHFPSHPNLHFDFPLPHLSLSCSLDSVPFSTHIWCVLTSGPLHLQCLLCLESITSFPFLFKCYLPFKLCPNHPMYNSTVLNSLYPLPCFIFLIVFITTWHLFIYFFICLFSLFLPECELLESGNFALFIVLSPGLRQDLEDQRIKGKFDREW